MQIKNEHVLFLFLANFSRFASICKIKLKRCPFFTGLKIIEFFFIEMTELATEKIQKKLSISDEFHDIVVVLQHQWNANKNAKIQQSNDSKMHKITLTCVNGEQTLNVRLKFATQSRLHDYYCLRSVYAERILIAVTSYFITNYVVKFVIKQMSCASSAVVSISLNMLQTAKIASNFADCVSIFSERISLCTYSVHIFRYWCWTPHLSFTTVKHIVFMC